MREERYKKLVILHSNDIHGDFLSEEQNGALIGGMSRLSGYVQKTRGEENHVIYCISGDMLQGSLIDSEYRGLSTIEIMNMLNPDVASLGNHETDYGLTHLLLLERCARFPILNANIFVKNPFTRIFQSHIFITINGMRIMFIGVITEEVMNGIKSDSLLGELIGVSDAVKEVGRICNAYNTTDVDLTILLTHLGFEEDKKLAALLDPDWGVDIIIGGHSHTLLQKPEVINNILIVQANYGTDQVGRFDIVVDTDLNTVDKYEWKLVPITDETCPRDVAMENIVHTYKEQTDKKFSCMLCRLPRMLTHPSRNKETELGNLFSDAIKACLGADIVLYGSGSIRMKEMGPIVTLGNLLETAPFHAKMVLLTITGRQLKTIWKHILREEAFTGTHTEFFQFSRGLEIVWSRREQKFSRITYLGEPVTDNKKYSLVIQNFHRDNFEASFGLPFQEVIENGREVVIATDEQDVLVEYFTDNKPEVCGVEGRLTILQ